MDNSKNMDKLHTGSVRIWYFNTLLLKTISIVVIGFLFIFNSSVAAYPILGSVSKEKRDLRPTDAKLNNSEKLEDKLGGAPSQNELEIRQKKLEKFLNLGEEHFKYEENLLLNNWNFVKGILQGKVLPPLQVEIQPTSNCNDKCRWCVGLPYKPSKPVSLDKKSMLKLIDEIHNYGVKMVKFAGFYGEPLLNPATIAAMKRAIDLGMEVGLHTNGREVNQRARDVVVDATYIHFSLDAGSNEVYNFLKQTQGRIFDHIISNIAELVRLKEERKTNVRIGISFLIQPENYTQINSIAKKAKEIGVDYIQFKTTLADPLGQFNPQELRGAYKYLKEARAYYSTDDFKVIIMQAEEEAKQEMSKSPFPDYENCLVYSFIGAVSASGDICPCHHRSYKKEESFGNIKGNSFIDIWQGTKRQKVMRSLDPSKMCPTCARYEDRMNKFLIFLNQEYAKDLNFLDWMEERIVGLKKSVNILDLFKEEKEVSKKTRGLQIRSKIFPYVNVKFDKERTAKFKEQDNPIILIVYPNLLFDNPSLALAIQNLKKQLGENVMVVLPYDKSEKINDFCKDIKKLTGGLTDLSSDDFVVVPREANPEKVVTIVKENLEKKGLNAEGMKLKVIGPQKWAELYQKVSEIKDILLVFCEVGEGSRYTKGDLAVVLALLERVDLRKEEKKELYKRWDRNKEVFEVELEKLEKEAREAKDIEDFRKMFEKYR